MAAPSPVRKVALSTQRILTSSVSTQPSHSLAPVSIFNNGDALSSSFRHLRACSCSPGCLQSTASLFRGRKQAPAGPGEIWGVKAHLSSLKFKLINPEHLTISSSGLESSVGFFLICNQLGSSDWSHAGFSHKAAL